MRFGHLNLRLIYSFIYKQMSDRSYVWPKIALLAETTLLSSTTGTNSGETRMTLDLMNVCFGSSLLVSNNRRQSRGPVTLLQKFLCNDVTFLSQLNSLFQGMNFLQYNPAVAFIKPATVSVVLPHIRTLRYSYLLAMCCKLHHWYNEDYRFVSNNFYDLIISRCSKRNSCCQGFVSVAPVVI